MFYGRLSALPIIDVPRDYARFFLISNEFDATRANRLKENNTPRGQSSSSLPFSRSLSLQSAKEFTAQRLVQFRAENLRAWINFGPTWNSSGAFVIVAPRVYAVRGRRRGRKKGDVL